jgi:hypothetical protein
MPSIVPFVPGDSEQTIAITLDNEPYVLRARWNTTDAAWYLDAWERDGTTPIAFGIKLVLGVLLGRTLNHPLFLAGMFMVDDSGTGVEAGLSDLGARVTLWHMTAADTVLAGLPRARS